MQRKKYQQVRLFSLFLAIIVVASMAFCWSSQGTQNRVLTEAPTRQAAAVKYQPGGSTVGLRATMSYESIRNALTRLTTQPHREKGSGRHCEDLWIKAKVFGKEIKTKAGKHCFDYHYDFTVQREGTLAVQRHGERVRVVVPVAARGYVGFKGALAKALALDKKNIDGSLNAILDVAFDLDETWCPALKVDASHQWRTAARLEIVGGVQINLSGEADKLITDLKKDAQQKLGEILDCESFRGQIAPHWRAYSFPLALPGGESVHVNLEPRRFTFSGMRAESDRVGVALGLLGAASLDPHPINTAPRPLPRVERATGEPGPIAFEIPIRMPYEQLESILRRELTRTPYAAETAVGQVSVSVRDVEVYASGRRLVIGLDFSADGLRRVLSVSGKAYVSGRPEVNEGGRSVFLTDIEFSRVLDNQLWSALASLFDGQILEAIEKNGRYDFTEPAQELERRINDTLENPANTGGLLMRVESPRLAVRGIYPEVGTLTVVVLAKTRVEAEIPMPDARE